MRGKLDPYYRYQHEKQMLKNDKKRQEENIKKEEERLNKVAQQNRDIIKYSETHDELDDLIRDAKKSGDYSLASDLLDRKAELEAKREVDRIWIKKGPISENLAIKILRKLKKDHPEEIPTKKIKVEMGPL